MALANVAALLARDGLRVLAVDWDLEAPGLDRYFSGRLQPLPESDGGGLLDFIADASRGAAKAKDWKRYASAVDLRPGKLTLITSGRQNEQYAARVLSLDWAHFFGKAHGGEFIEALRDQWREAFDVTLIDSRTGITDSGGVCTIQIPDVLVPVFTANEQSLEGTKEIVQRAQLGRQQLAYDRAPFLVFPLPSRFDGRTEVEEAQKWLDRFTEELAPFYADWVPATIDVREVVERTKLPYIAYFSFGEKLPVVTHSTTDPESLGHAYSIAASLIGADFKNVAEALGGRFAAAEPPPPVNGNTDPLGYEYDVYVSYRHSQAAAEIVKTLVTHLTRYLELLLPWKPRVFVDWTSLLVGSFLDRTVAALERSRCLLALLTPAYFESDWCRHEYDTFEAREARLPIDHPPLLFPVVLRGVEMLPRQVYERRQFVDLSKLPLSFVSRPTRRTEEALNGLAEAMARSILAAPPHR